MNARITTALATALLLANTGCANLVHALHKGNAAKEEPTGPLSPGQEGYVDPGPYAGPLAQKYAGQVVFSAKPIGMKDTDDSSAYASGYNLGDPLYIRFFAKESGHNLLPRCKSPRRIVRVDINGAYAGKPAGGVPSIGSYQLADPMTLGASSLTNEVTVPVTSPTTWTAERETAANHLIRGFNSQAVAAMHEGTNSLRILLTLDCGYADAKDPVEAEGTLQVEVKPGAKKAYLAKYGTQLTPSPHPENAKLVPQILKAMKAKPDWDNEDLLGARVVSEDWIPVRNQVTGALVAKAVEAVLVVHAKKEENPDVCRLFTMSYARDAAGGPLYYNGTGDPTPFPCVNAPKS